MSFSKITNTELKNKMKAQSLVAKAIKQGILTRPLRCSECGSDHPRIEAHHADYTKPLDVEFLCKRCHHARHFKGRHTKG